MSLLKGKETPTKDTPVKITFELSPQTIVNVCLICAKNMDINNRQRLFDRSNLFMKTVLCRQVESVLDISLQNAVHPNNICRSCSAKVKTVIRKKEDLISTFQDSQRTLVEKFQRVKRLSKDTLQHPVSKKSLFKSPKKKGKENQASIGVAPLSPNKQTTHMLPVNEERSNDTVTQTGLISLLNYPARQATLTVFHHGSPSKIPRPVKKYASRTVQTDADIKTTMKDTEVWVSYLILNF